MGETSSLTPASSTLCKRKESVLWPMSLGEEIAQLSPFLHGSQHATPPRRGCFLAPPCYWFYMDMFPQVRLEFFHLWQLLGVWVHLENVAFGKPFGCLHRSRQPPTFHQQWSQLACSVLVRIHLPLNWFRSRWGRENPICQSPKAPTVSENNTEFTGPFIQKVKFFQQLPLSWKHKKKKKKWNF